MDLEGQYRLAAIFMPHIVEQRVSLAQQSRRLVHYTSAENARKMITSREVWLRNVRYMNDASEVDHGTEMMLRFFSEATSDLPDQGRHALAAAVDSIKADLLNQAIAQFNDHMSAIGTRTFVACLSEHDSKEDLTGRLSMWRGYGTNAAPVAVVINTQAFYGVTDALGVFSNPVSYWSQDQYLALMRSIPARIAKEMDFLRSIEDHMLVHMIF
jgi:hypothetical protein